MNVKTKRTLLTVGTLLITGETVADAHAFDLDKPLMTEKAGGALTSLPDKRDQPCDLQTQAQHRRQPQSAKQPQSAMPGTGWYDNAWRNKRGTASQQSEQNSVSAHPAGETAYAFHVDEALPIKYWGNSFSGKFHRPSCPFAQAMSIRHVIFFNFRRQAIEAGQSPCLYCLPPFWTSVKCNLMPAQPPTNQP